MIATSFVAAGLIAIALIALFVYRFALDERARARRRAPQRSYELEARIKTVLNGPRRKYGDIFTEYSVWRLESETRLELTAGDPWRKLNAFTRSLVVRYLWRVLEGLSGGAVVVVDEPRQVWDEDVDSGFHDQGFDWKTFGHGPQFIHEP